jgi:hypothetical protein
LATLVHEATSALERDATEAAALARDALALANGGPPGNPSASTAVVSVISHRFLHISRVWCDENAR